MNPTFEFSAELWLHNSGSWIFVTVPQDESDEISDVAPDVGGFGSVRVEVAIGSTTWRTSVFPSAELGCYVLPIKKPVRKAEKIDLGDVVDLALTVLMD
jgi:hypothetical protein